MGKRFSKSIITKWLQDKVEDIEKRYSFKKNTGYIQVMDMGGEVNRAYGEWRQCLDLISMINR